MRAGVAGRGLAARNRLTPVTAAGGPDPIAAGYAACFGGALDLVGKKHRKDAMRARITCAVSIGPRDAGGFGLAVKLHVEDRSLPKGELAALAQEAHEQICPYSHATRGNVPVELTVEGS